MNVEEYCLSLPGASENYPFGDGVAVFKVGGKMFALTNPTGKPATINLKCEPVRARILRQDHPEIIPGYHMNKENWNTLDLHGNLTDDLVRESIDDSYALVAPKR